MTLAALFAAAGNLEPANGVASEIEKPVPGFVCANANRLHFALDQLLVVVRIVSPECRHRSRDRRNEK